MGAWVGKLDIPPSVAYSHALTLSVRTDNNCNVIISRKSLLMVDSGVQSGIGQGVQSMETGFWMMEI